MWSYISSLYTQLARLKQTIGVVYFVLGSPITFFLRDSVRLAPNSPIFSAGALVFSMILMIPSDFLTKIYKPNIMFAKMGWGFLMVSFWFMLFYNPGNDYFDYFRESGNFLFILVFFIILLHISDKIEDYILPVVVIITLLGSLALLYSILKNPNFILGMRVAIFSGDDSEDVGNPHVFARNGMAGFIASFLLLSTRNLLWKLVAYANLFISFALMVMAGARGVLLAWAICILLYFIFHFRYATVKAGLKSFFNIRNTIVVLLISVFVINWMSKNAKIQETIIVYSDSIVRNWDKISATLFGGATAADTKTFDESAGNRIKTIGLFWRIYEDYGSELIIGKGYKYVYLDVPILEAFLDCGILGFLLFFGTNYLCIKYSIVAIKSQESKLTSFLGYFYWAYFIGSLTGGRPFDTFLWFYFMIMIRFMGLPKRKELSVETPENLPQLT